MEKQQIYTPSLKRRKQILANICKQQKSWKIRIIVMALLFAVSAGIISEVILILIQNSTSNLGIFVFLCAGICIACVPFFIAISVKNTAKYKCGYPYSSQANGTLILSENSLEYVFWRVGLREPAAYSSKRAVYCEEDKFVYHINKEDIQTLSIHDGVCEIKGTGHIKMPTWAVADLSTQEYPNHFAFALAFEQENAEKEIQAW